MGKIGPPIGRPEKAIPTLPPRHPLIFFFYSSSRLLDILDASDALEDVGKRGFFDTLEIRFFS